MNQRYTRCLGPECPVNAAALLIGMIVEHLAGEYPTRERLEVFRDGGLTGLHLQCAVHQSLVDLFAAVTEGQGSGLGWNSRACVASQMSDSLGEVPAGRGARPILRRKSVVIGEQRLLPVCAEGRERDDAILGDLRLCQSEQSGRKRPVLGGGRRAAQHGSEMEFENRHRLVARPVSLGRGRVARISRGVGRQVGMGPEVHRVSDD